ncbi:MAG: hypothetical protein JJU11_03645 [Candidatus Sumerlaeia bacterium]|nr:hypothetical protein [Candidatus Sumerlaeia bacterium]
MIRTSLLVGAVALLAGGCAKPRVQEEPVVPSTAPDRVNVTWIHVPGDDPATALRNRLREDKSFHGLLLIDTGENLLDPRSVRLTWEGEPIDHFVYYKSPGSALLFVLPDQEPFRQQTVGYLKIHGAMLGENRTAVIQEFPLLFSDDDFEEQETARKNRGGERIQVVNPERRPIEGAWLFGQRREDLVTRSDEGGMFQLDAPSRSSSPIHYAWADGFWTHAFDPVHERRVTLLPRLDATNVELDFTLTSPDGERIDSALLLVADDTYLHWRGSAMNTSIPADRDAKVLIMAPGHSQRLLDINELTDGNKVELIRSSGSN